MAKEKEINKRRRRIAEKIYLQRLANPKDSQQPMDWLAKTSCLAADALMHEFDERGWQ
jgi:hypothetical protein